MTTVDTERFCPYHGGRIRLVDCPIVSTNDSMNAAALRTAGIGINIPKTPKAPAGVNYSIGGDPDDYEDDPDDRYEPTAEFEEMRVAPAAEAPSIAGMRKSAVDHQQRVLLAHPPKIAAPVRTSRFSKKPPSPELPSPVELARDRGGAQASPARACPVCLHPLPASIDRRELHLIALAGHTGASKTSTMLALIDESIRRGPHALGVKDFAVTETTMEYVTRKDTEDSSILENYRSGKDTPGTDQGRHPPLEFTTTLPETQRYRPTQATVLIHDAAGEDISNRQARLDRVLSLLWADVILFVYDPVESPALATGANKRMDQAMLLNALREGIENRGPRDASGRQYDEPHLVIAISKADALHPPRDLRGGLPDRDEVIKTFYALDDGGMVGAAQRWPEDRVHWAFMAPKPTNGSAQGVTDVFALILKLLNS